MPTNRQEPSDRADRRERLPTKNGSRLSDWFADPKAKVLMVAEIGQAHDGSLGTAHAYIDLVASAGVDAVKFQTHIADAESTLEEPWRVHFSPQDEHRIDYWRRMEFTPEQWAGLKQHAEDRELIFLSSPFSIEAVDLLEALGIEGWKIASGELSNLPMLEHLRHTRKPALLSTGMSDWPEIDRTVAFFREPGTGRNPPLAIFQCTSAYPCPAEQVGLNLIDQLAQRYECRTGLSDHSGTIYPILAGVARGMSMAEFHVTLSEQSFGPDVPASLAPEPLRQLVQGVRAIETMLAHPVNKQAAASELGEMRRLFGRSLVASHSLPTGHLLVSGDLAAKKPGTGLPPSRLPELLGRALRRDLKRDEQLSEEDLGPAPATSEDVL